jgi:mercuric ion binding protein
VNKILALALCGLAVMSPVISAPSSAQTVATEQTVTFAIDNMTCALCPVTVKRAMEAVAGVRAVAVDFEARTATVVIDPAATDATAVADASANAGYPARVLP